MTFRVPTPGATHREKRVTIVESALKRAKEEAEKAGTTARGKGSARAAENISARRAPHSDAEAPYSETVAPATGPPQAFSPQACRVNIDYCQQRRVLLGDERRPVDLAVSRAVGMLRTRLLHRVRSHGWLTVGITSASPQDGKSLTSINLALSLAREKSHQVFLIDSDLMKPSICSYLGIEPPTEILEYFEGRCEPRDLFVSIGVENLLIAGGSAHCPHSSELLSTPRLEELIAFVKTVGVNPLVIVDLPPVLSTDDVLVLAPRLDAILLVVSEGKTARSDVERATKLLSEFHLAGLVLNRSREAVTGSYYGYAEKKSD